MSDLISRQAAIDALDQIFDRCEEIEAHLPEGDPDRTGYKMYPDYMTVWKYLHQLPPAPPEIIYCKDCGHRDDHGCCKYWKGLAMSETPIATDDYDFCNHAKRREHE